jgi:DNA-binding transcriptional ArsR family regulator
MVMSVSLESPCSQKLDAVFAALADPTRRAILHRLAQGDARIGDIAAPFAISQPAISKHVRVLEHAGLIARGDARLKPVKINPAPLAKAVQWLADFEQQWTGNLQRLDNLLAELQGLEGNKNGD